MGVSKVDYFGETLIDMTDATVTEGTLLAGAKAYDAAGNLIEGAVVIALIDNTLTVSGAAADAKATGDALAGTVKKNGDTLTGNLYIENSSYPSVRLDDTATGSEVSVQNYGQSAVIDVFNVKGSGSKRRSLGLRSSGAPTSGLKNAVFFRDVGETDIYYDIYGEHNIEASMDELGYVKGAKSNLQEQIDGKAGTEHTHADYLSKTGGAVEGELVFNGSGQAGSSKIVLETGKGRITNSGINVLLGFLSETDLAVGYGDYALKLRGRASAPTYNGTNIALSGHTHQKVNNPDGVGFITLIKDGSYFFRAGDADNSYNCGSTNYRWTTVYAKNALNTSSDMRLKKDFSEDYSKYIDMLDRIRPTTFVRTNTGDGKRHTGYKAQAVLKAMKEAGLAEDDFAGFERHMQEEGSVYTYGLAYEEFIPVLHAKIKQLEERIRQLEEKEK